MSTSPRDADDIGIAILLGLVAALSAYLFLVVAISIGETEQVVTGILVGAILILCLVTLPGVIVIHAGRASRVRRLAIAVLSLSPLVGIGLLLVRSAM